MASYVHLCLSILVASFISAFSQEACPLDLSPFKNTDISICKGSSLSSSCCNLLYYVENTIAFSNSDLYAAVITNAALQAKCVTAYKTTLNASGVTGNPFNQCPNAYLLRPVLINSTNSCPELYLQDVSAVVNFTALALNCTTQTAGCTTCLSSIQAYATVLAGAGAPTSTVLDCGIVVAQLLVNQEGAIANKGVVTIDRTNLCTQQLTSYPPPSPPFTPPSPAPLSPPPSIKTPPPVSKAPTPPGVLSSPPPATVSSPPSPATAPNPPGVLSSPPPATTLSPPPSFIATPPSVPPSIAPSPPPSPSSSPPITPSPSVTPSGAPPPPTTPSPAPSPSSSPTPAPGPSTTPSTAPAPSPSLVPSGSPSGSPSGAPVPAPSPAEGPSSSPTESPAAPPPPPSPILSPPPPATFPPPPSPILSPPPPATFPPLQNVTASPPPPPRSGASHSAAAMAVSGVLLLVSFALLA